MENQFTVSVVVNNVSYSRTIDPRILLSDFLRHELNLTGTHIGCEHGSCGACTVLMRQSASEGSTDASEWEAVRSCIMFAVQANGHAITTVEGLSEDLNKLHPLQEAFREKHALQCGYCTPGFLMTILPFLAENSNPSEQEIGEMLSGNICRCTGYQNIVEAVKLAAKSDNWSLMR